MAKQLLNYSTPYILNGEFFEIISQNGESVTVRCCHCETRNIYKGSVKSTGNFHMHIKRKHPQLLNRVHELKISSFLNRKMIPHKRSFSKSKKLIEINKQDKDNNNVTNLNNTKNNDITKNQINSCETIIQKNLVSENLIKEEIVSNSDDNHQADHNSSNSHCTSIPCIQQIFEPESSRSTSPIKSHNEDILTRMENTLKNIEKELRLRNQIESNRLFLELAKFKYLHPQFNFNL